MTHIIALTQFVFIALGTMAINILVKLSSHNTVIGQDSSSLAGFLANNGIWFFLIPIFWTAFAHLSNLLQKHYFTTKVAHPIGIAISVGLFLMYTYVIYFSFLS